MKESYSTGYPDKPGLYKVIADGKEMVLRHSICELSGKHRWIMLNGHDIIAQEIKFGKKASLADLK